MPFPRSWYGNTCLTLPSFHPQACPAPLRLENLIFEKAVKVSEGLKLEGGVVETLPSLPSQVKVYVCVFVWGSKAPFGLERVRLMSA